jgi:hypothetical protein
MPLGIIFSRLLGRLVGFLRRELFKRRFILPISVIVLRRTDDKGPAERIKLAPELAPNNAGQGVTEGDDTT